VDGALVAYNAWTYLVPPEPEKSWSQLGVGPDDPIGIPSIRVLDLATGKDTLLADGAYSVAWRADGALAYVQGAEREVRAAGPYLGRIVVRSSLDAPAEVWTPEPDRYIVYGWAGNVLLAYRMRQGEALDVLALTARGAGKTLGVDSEIVAIAPEGDRVLLQDREGGMYALRLVDPATGADLAILDLASAGATLAGSPLLRISYGGSWVGNLVVSEGVAPTETGTATGIVVIEVGSDAVRLVQSLALPAQRFPMGAYDPRFTDASGSRFVAWATIPGAGGEANGQLYVYLDCRLEATRCVQGPPVTDRIFNPVYNPSRPSTGVVPGG